MKRILIYTVLSPVTLLLLFVGNTECSQNISMKKKQPKDDTTSNMSQSFKPESYIMAMAMQNKKSLEIPKLEQLKKTENSPTDISAPFEFSNLTERLGKVTLGVTTQGKTRTITGKLTKIAPKTISEANLFDCSQELIKKLEKEAKTLYKKQIEQKQREQSEIIEIINKAIYSLKSQEPCRLPNCSVFYKPNKKAPLATNFTHMLKALPFNIDKKLLVKLEEKNKTFQEQLETIAKMFKNKSEKYKQQLKSVNDDTDTDLNNPIFKKYLKTIYTYLQVKPPEATYTKYRDNPAQFFTEYRKNCFDQLGEQIIEKCYTFGDNAENVFVKEVLNDQFKFKKN